MSQHEAAMAMGIPDNFHSRWENGHHIPDRWNVAEMAKLYALDVDELMMIRKEEAARQKEARRQAARAARAPEVSKSARKAAPPPPKTDPPRKRGQDDSPTPS